MTDGDHGRINNSLHWVLDMNFGENQSRIRKKSTPLYDGLTSYRINKKRNTPGYYRGRILA